MNIRSRAETGVECATAVPGQSAGTTTEEQVREHALVVPPLMEVTETVAAESGAAASDPIGLDVLAEECG